MNPINYIYIARASSSFIKNIFFSFFAIWLIYEDILTTAQTAIELNRCAVTYHNQLHSEETKRVSITYIAQTI